MEGRRGRTDERGESLACHPTCRRDRRVVVVVAAVVAVVTAWLTLSSPGHGGGVVVTTAAEPRDRSHRDRVVIHRDAPLIARARPFTVAPVFSVIDVVARIDPAKSLVVPRCGAANLPEHVARLRPVLEYH